MNIFPYFSPFDPVATNQYAASQTSRAEVLRLTNRDLHSLLSTREATFSDLLLRDASIRQFTTSFLKQSPRPYDWQLLKFSSIDKSEQARQQRQLEALLRRRAFMLLMRSTLMRYSPNQSSNENIATIVNNSVGNGSAAKVTTTSTGAAATQQFTLETFVNICSIYGYNNARMLRLFLTSLMVNDPDLIWSKCLCTMAQPGQKDAASAAIISISKQIAELREQLFDLVGKGKKPVGKAALEHEQRKREVSLRLVDLARALYDTVFSLRITLEVFPFAVLAWQRSTRDFALEKSLLSHMVLVYEVVLPVLAELFQNEELTATVAAVAPDALGEMDLYVNQTYFNSIQIGDIIIRECYRARINGSLVKHEAVDQIERHFSSALEEITQDAALSALLLPSAGEKPTASDLLSKLKTYFSKNVSSTLLESSVESLETECLDVLRELCNISSHAEFRSQLPKILSVPSGHFTTQVEGFSYELESWQGSYVLDYNYMHRLSGLLQQWRDSSVGNKSRRSSAISAIIDQMKLAQSRIGIEMDLQEHVKESELEDAGKNLDVDGGYTPEVNKSKYARQIEELKEFFPDLGRGFLHVCLSFFKGDKQKLSNVLLEGKVPQQLQKLDRTLEHIPDEEEVQSLLASQVLNRINFDTYQSGEGSSSSGSGSQAYGAKGGQKPKFKISVNKSLTGTGANGPTSPTSSVVSQDDISPVPWEHVNMFSAGGVQLGKRKDKDSLTSLTALDDDLRRKIIDSAVYDDEYDDTYDDIIKFDLDLDSTDGQSSLKREIQSGGNYGGAQQQQQHQAPHRTRDASSQPPRRQGDGGRSQQQSQQPQQARQQASSSHHKPAAPAPAPVPAKQQQQQQQQQQEADSSDEEGTQANAASSRGGRGGRGGERRKQAQQKHQKQQAQKKRAAVFVEVSK